ncbi:polyphosphate--glucose phosphotransferase [Rubrivirga sp.]|uniref:polyphosphate--glucose phosphotransferase n=1 Tax=Rubrivirga sp. TaxID=1885344 RepID=UPI003C78E9CE
MGKKKKVSRTVLGIDIGGSGVKGAPVHTKKGELTDDRYRIPTPQPATPEAVLEVVRQIVDEHKWRGPIGCTIPGRVIRGVVRTAANIDESWEGYNARKRFKKELGVPVTVLNDADAAGIAEIRFGAGKKKGTTLVLTLGTGIGSALFTDGVLVPNTEFGHLRFDHRIAEHVAADSIRTKDHLSWERWATKRVQPVLEMYEFLFSPDTIVIGGGVSKPERWDQFGPLLKTNAKLYPAALGNQAGIVGAALVAREAVLKSRR